MAHENIYVRVSEDLKRRLEAAAERLRQTQTAWVTHAIEEHLARQETGETADGAA